jgi:5-formyltetrahydrofolate cyclo-ligase
MPLLQEPEIPEKKDSVRNLIRGTLSGLSEKKRRNTARAISAKLFQMECWTQAQSLLVYMSFGSEFDTHDIINEALKNGKSVYIPAVVGNLLEFRRISTPDESLERGVLGIREPGKDAPIWKPSGSPGPTLVLVPGLAFDGTGGRLGRGRGYYDRFIASVRRCAREAGERPPLFVGLCCREQVLPELPMDGHDERLDGLVTDDFAVLFRTL